MNFGIDAVVLWSRKDEIRSLKFERNKVNVITGESQTGKSTILKIFDYCFLASSHDIPHDVINDNVSWYGIKFYINDKNFFLARRSPIGDKVSPDYYFSSLGYIPRSLLANINSDDLRTILETEFSIDARIRMPFGGKAIKAGSRISLRYFFLFNTISDDIILNSKNFFDKQEIDRYREALPRVFDIALGIDDLENIIARDRKELLLKEINKIERKNKAFLDNQSSFTTEIREIAAKATEYGLTPELNKSVTATALYELLNHPNITPNYDASTKRRSDINSQLFAINRQIRKYSNFNEEYRSYKSTVKQSRDSLKPLKILIERSNEMVKSEVFDELISSLQVDLRIIEEAIKARQPVESQVNTEIRYLQDKKRLLAEELQVLPENPSSFTQLHDMWIFLGEAKGKLSIYSRLDERQTKNPELSELNKLKDEYESIQVKDVEAERSTTISLIEEVAKGLMEQVKAALENYGNWNVSFNYKEKKIQLRRPKSTLICISSDLI